MHDYNTLTHLHVEVLLSNTERLSWRSPGF